MPLPIETERLLLRPKTLDDVEALLELFTDPVAMRFHAGGATTREGVRELVERDIAMQEEHGFSLLAVVERRTGKVIGDAGFQPLEEGPEIEIGVRIARKYWASGYADELIDVLWEYGIIELEIERIVGVTVPWHRASRRLMERAGMRYAGKGVFYGKPGVKYVATSEDFIRRRDDERDRERPRT